MNNNYNQSKEIGDYLNKNKLIVSTAESCTAGLISSILAETPGSSAWLDAGFVVYSPEAKNKSLNVSFDTINTYNITSCEVAEEMAKGAILKSRANIGISTTGVAGPSGGTKEIPVGTVCFGWSFIINEKIVIFSEKIVFEGTRNQIRTQAAEYALKHIPLYYEKVNNQVLPL